MHSADKKRAWSYDCAGTKRRRATENVARTAGSISLFSTSFSRFRYFSPFLYISLSLTTFCDLSVVFLFSSIGSFDSSTRFLLLLLRCTYPHLSISLLLDYPQFSLANSFSPPFFPWRLIFYVRAGPSGFFHSLSKKCIIDRKCCYQMLNSSLLSSIWHRTIRYVRLLLYSFSLSMGVWI